MGIFPTIIFRPIARVVSSPNNPSRLEFKSPLPVEVKTNVLTATDINYALLKTFPWYSAFTPESMTMGSEGTFGPNLSENISNMTMDSYGGFIEYILLSSNTSNMTMGSCGEAILPGFRKHWVAWSNIGSLDFSITRGNVAGEMPLDWDGYVQNIHKLGSRVVAYGDNGVSVLTPSGNAYGLNTIHRIGLKGRDAFAGNDFVHYFIDKKGCLYSLDDKLFLLDYREYLSEMTDPVMTFDEENRIVYICDGTLGYIYSPDNKSLGSGPVNVTGIGSKGGSLYVASPSTITTPTFEICTDIIDFGTRRMKTVYQLEFGTDVTGVLSAAVDYRENKASSFTTTPWEIVNERGIVKIIRKGTEFRFRAKLAAYESFELDSFTIDGKIHVH